MRLALPALLACLCLPAAAAEQDGRELLAPLNTLRNRNAVCQGRNVAGAPPLALNPALSQVAAALSEGAGGDLNTALAQAGYRSRRSFVLSISGMAGTDALARYADRSFCAALRSAEVSEIGIHRRGNATTLVLARPQALPRADAQDQERAGARILELVNQARAHPRLCGKHRYAAAAPLRWDARLAAASLAYARDLAQHHYLSHTGRDGSQPGARAQRAGYVWRAVGENLASGQTTPEEAVAGWLESPGHCANVMNAAYSVMGAGYAVSGGDNLHVYWAQLFAAPR